MRVLKALGVVAASICGIAVLHWLASETEGPEDIQQAVRNSISVVIKESGDKAEWLYDILTEKWWLPVPNRFEDVSIIISVRDNVTVMEAQHIRFGIIKIEEHNRVVLADADLALGEMWELCANEFGKMRDDEGNPE